jgi:hypothetical protein
MESAAATSPASLEPHEGSETSTLFPSNSLLVKKSFDRLFASRSRSINDLPRLQLAHRDSQGGGCTFRCHHVRKRRHDTGNILSTKFLLPCHFPLPSIVSSGSQPLAHRAHRAGHDPAHCRTAACRGCRSLPGSKRRQPVVRYHAWLHASSFEMMACANKASKVAKIRAGTDHRCGEMRRLRRRKPGRKAKVPASAGDLFAGMGGGSAQSRNMQGVTAIPATLVTPTIECPALNLSDDRQPMRSWRLKSREGKRVGDTACSAGCGGRYATL